MTPPPTPTPKPTLPPKPTPSERDRKAQEAVDTAMGYADRNVKYTEKGTSEKSGFDCSGLVKSVSQGTNLVFGQGYIGESAQGMVTSFSKSNGNFGDELYNYKDYKVFPTLMPGDLVFSANPGNLEKVKHVTMATGNGLQVVEASDRKGIEKVTYQFDAYDKINKDGLFVRDTDQVVVYVFRPNY
jgi:cell wall-associated NlpC family hydrolase